MRSTSCGSRRLVTSVGLGLAMLTAFCGLPSNASEKTVYTFRGGGDGGQPLAGLTNGGNGILYGTTSDGGEGAKCCGTLYKLTADRKETVLHQFSGGGDGENPSSPVVADGAGNLYGATAYGGLGAGMIFKLEPGRTETLLYEFQGTTDGNRPIGNIVQDQQGNIYGGTLFGGASGSDCPNGSQGCGTIFEVAPNGTETVLHAFQGGNDGFEPLGGVIIDGQGNLFGTTADGGTGSVCGGVGCGTVFEVASGGVETVLYDFQGGSDGSYPESSLIIDSKEEFFGTTKAGGLYGQGTVFELAPDGTETILHAFTGGNDGSGPEGGLALDQSGNLYGTTYAGGQKKFCENALYGCGTVFKLATDGTETVLYTFKGRRGGPTRGAFPAAPLLLNGNGVLYGTASEGGKNNDGVVFSVSTR